MSVLLSVNKIRTTENKDLCGSEQGYLKPKRDDSTCLLLRVTWLVLFEAFE